MTTILQMTQEDLRAEIKSCLRESIEEIRSLPAPTPLPDRITLIEACELTGFSRSQIYKMSMNDQIPRARFGKRLIFSRRELQEWIEARTISASRDGEIINKKLANAARKRLNSAY